MLKYIKQRLQQNGNSNFGVLKVQINLKMLDVQNMVLKIIMFVILENVDRR